MHEKKNSLTRSNGNRLLESKYGEKENEEKIWNKFSISAVGRVALDTRLGCVSKEGNDESKRIIDAINTFFWTVAEVELRMPVWRFYSTKAYKNYIGALDSFTE